jgi:hypothetical protein
MLILVLPGQHVSHFLLKVRTVEQSCQSIVMRHMSDLRLNTPSIGYVLMSSNPAAGGKWGVFH